MLPRAAWAASPADATWPDWKAFVDSQIQTDGRVIDFTTPEQQSTSEGQSYALFFALVANDRATFDTVLGWTANNLCEGKLDARLPAWQWGRKADGSYGVLDANSASDADAWIAYALLEAGRLWRERRYAESGRALLPQIAQREVADLPGLGPMLLPGEHGFTPAEGTWRLNPSYLPLPLLRRFAIEDPAGPWERIADNTVRMIAAASPHGFVPDWLAWRAGQGFIVDPAKGDVGSYDAIRVYLWAGMTSPRDPLAAPLLDALAGMRSAVSNGNAGPPERVATAEGTLVGSGPVGFSAALLPYLRASGDLTALDAQRARIASMLDAARAAKTAVPYYDRVLLLFGEGWADGRYRFDENGQLVLSAGFV
ncbi:cellulose synthase complex periplasmic endoglucanase BcsZ [Paraburkholderia kururiensis]|uniref:Glucanase n=1 Tax=Paraburkholderia kururiensis TaxID=984307 RepID=A0ABZ0WUR2_9BURK|nr:cellulose synthase complex periplasmic endoglucanase BcsZ [Paraburkholderia kururiensis]WQD81129.1 cellulose synthase complex periplasmic endoglucanase BcsZ [Paraburkholderia kururiensis]